MPSQRVLIVEDNIDGGRTLAGLLRSAGHDVEHAIDGDAAIDIARKFQPDIVFLDIGLPGIDGWEVCRRLRKEPVLRTVRIVAVTGYAQLKDQARSVAAGCDMHLVKPVSTETLLNLIDM